MANTTLPSKLRIASYNMKGHARDRIDYMNTLLQSNDILFVQEHWYLSSQLSNLEASLSNVNVIGISGINESELLTGRPYGGCAIVYDKRLKCIVTPVELNSKRCMAAIVLIGGCQIIFINVYMPCDSHSTQHDLVFNDVLNDINLVINKYPHIGYVLIGGDFNTDLCRLQSPHCISLNEFCERESMFICSRHNVANVDFTFESAMGHRSFIDHFMVSQNLIDSIISYNVRHDGHNLSDHNAIQLCINIPVERVSSIEEGYFLPHTLWRNADEDHINNYKHKLTNLLSIVDMSPSCHSCTNVRCDSHYKDIDGYYNAIVTACIESTHVCIPKSSPYKPVAGWSEQVKPFKDRSVFWNRLWTDNGCVRQGVIYNIMLKTKADYKRVSRRVIRSQNRLTMERMADGLLNNNTRSFWQEVRKISKSCKSSVSIVDGAQGENDISNIFLNKYKSLYTSVSYDTTEMKHICDRVNSDVSSQCSTGECNTTHVITPFDVSGAVSKMKLYKGDAQFELFSNNLIHGCDELFEHLSILFNSMLHHGYTPVAMNLSSLIPIPKSNKKSISDSNNYRAIAIGSVIGKVLDNIILFKNLDKLCTSELQFGFKPKHSTTQCTFVLNEIVDLYIRNDSSLHLILLDASQAFDRVHYCKLFNILIDRKVCCQTIRLLINMYTTQRLRVKWGNSISDSFLCMNGVKQGGVLSPILFCIYMDVLLCRLTQAGVGCYIGTRFCGALCYADDLTLIAPSRYSMKVLLNICDAFAREFNVKFNPSKSVHISFNVDSELPFYITNVPIVKADNATHLGHVIGKDYNSKNISHGVSKLINNANTMLAKFGHCSSGVKANLFQTYCTSFYGSVLWRLNSPIMSRFHVTWRKIIRRVWRLPNLAHSNLLPILMSDTNIDSQLMTRYAMFLYKIGISDNMLVRMCYRLLLSSNTPVASNRRRLMFKINVNDFTPDINYFRSKLYNEPSIDVVHVANCVKELCDVRDGVSVCDFDHTEIIDMIYLLSCL